ncbi:hypothetical protein [Mycolicibacterium elephantis]|uniref:hypothetical protein n=1 Tax=Mycolicibacterium elephantis TaxID=81858 RepID=UPI001042135C|nr:hypothetical protein [Mycolicibacterium elephantis]
MAAGILTPVCAFLGVVAGAWIGRRANVENAKTEARKAVTADWEAYSASIHQWATGLAARLEAVEARVGAAETRALAAEQRADRAERLYRAAIHYLREVAAWVAEYWPGEKMPAPPIELEGEI